MVFTPHDEMVLRYCVIVMLYGAVVYLFYFVIFLKKNLKKNFEKKKNHKKHTNQIKMSLDLVLWWLIATYQLILIW